ESELSCVFTESCVLPCGFPPGDDAVIHWIQFRTDGETQVHSYYQNRDQLGNQDPAFRGRTSLFGGQIPGGNASLLLGGVRVQDGGRYHCFISTVAGSYEDCVVLRVEAPVKAVSVHREGNSITCSSSWIYPEPVLLWASSPPLQTPSSSSLQNRTRVQRTQQQLYNISSSLLLPEGEADGSYSCTVSTASSSRTATLRSLSGAHRGGDEPTRIEPEETMGNFCKPCGHTNCNRNHHICPEMEEKKTRNGRKPRDRTAVTSDLS
ncbi:unnamed protein product, partial [Menidia menidia]